MKVRYILLICGLLISIAGKSQINSTSYNFTEATSYSEDDIIFVFCSETDDAGNLTAIDSTGIGGKTFEWYKFNSTSEDFTDPINGFDYNNDSTQTSMTSLASGGYKIIVKDDVDQIYVAWIYNTTDRYVDVQLDPFNDCEFLGLRTDPLLQVNRGFATSFEYFDTISNSSFNLSDTIKEYQWESDTEPAIQSISSPYITMAVLPLENTIFSVSVTDRFGCLNEDTVFYDAIATKTMFSWITIDYYTEEQNPEGGDHESDLSEEAPLVVKFKNESKNASKLYWWFGDSTRKDDVDSLVTSDLLLEPMHIYYYTRKLDGKTYTMSLTSESEEGCIDKVEFDIETKPVSIEFPNVFTPNDDDYNDVFHVEDMGDGPMSIRNFKITIFNRVGQVVHEYNGTMQDWEGWDGHIKNSGRKASEGTYYFVVEVKGWDKKTYDNDDYSKGSSEGDSNSDSNEQSASASMFGVLRLFR